MEVNERHVELSNKFYLMGDALLKEGIANNDFMIQQAGSLVALISALILDKTDTLIFGELVDMFAAKKILDKDTPDNKLTDDYVAQIINERNKGKNDLSVE